MDEKQFTANRTGRLVDALEGCKAFVPNPLPPKALKLEPLLASIASANRALGELSGIGRTLPNPYLLIRPFMRREAVASSKIEGTVTTLSELFLFEVDAEETRSSPDAREVLNYVRALEYALARLENLPISLRLLREVHEILLSNVDLHRGAAIVPGEFKRDQNWIGARLIKNARYVPPPPKESEDCMGKLEEYIHNMDEGLPLIVNLALIHYQFEAIHPFPDGNGRVGRLLIPLLMCERQEISQPLLYLSPFFEKNYDEYIDSMLRVSTHGEWEPWIELFVRAVEETSQTAVTITQRLLDIQRDYRERVQQARSSALLGQIVDLLFEQPAITIPLAAERLNIAYNGAKNNINRLVEHGILIPTSTSRRPRVFFASEIVNALTL
jgi:cell filamentation protein, protein adenylyltransferase